MYNLFRFIGLRHLLLKPGRTLLAVIGVSLGIALYIAIQIINNSTVASFQESVESIAGQSKLTVTGGATGFPEAQLDVIQNFPGVKSAVPLIVSRAFVVGRGNESLMVMGVDLLKEDGVRAYKTTDQQIIEDPFTFLNQPNSIILTKTFAKKRGLRINSPLEIATVSGSRTMIVRGLLEPEGPAKAYGGNFAIMDIDGARVTFGKENKLDRVDLILRKGIDPTTLAARLQKSLGDSYKVEDIQAQSRGLSQIISSYQTLLDLFSILALFVGVYLITNTINISVAERRNEIGTLRSLGALKYKIMALFMSEAFVLGVFGSFVGVCLGRIVAGLLMDLVMKSMSLQYSMPIQTNEIIFTFSQAVRGIAIGAIAAIFASIYPAYHSANLAPMEAMRWVDENEAANNQTQRKYGLAFGILLLVYLVISSWLNWSFHSRTIEIFDAMAAMIGVALVGPFAVLWLVYLFQMVIAKLGGFGSTITRLAQDNLMQNPQRTIGNVRILTVGLTLVVIMSSLSGSFKSSIINWYDRILTADILVSSFGNLIGGQVQPINESIAQELEKIPGVLKGPDRGAYGIRAIRLDYEGKQIRIKAYDEPNPADRYSIFEVLDRPTYEAGRELYSSSDLTTLVSENFAMNFKKKTGDTIQVNSPSGPLTFRIIGIVTEFSSPVGLIYLDRKIYKKFWNDPLVDSFALFAKKGYDPEMIRQDIDHLYSRSLNLMSVSQSELRQQIVESIDSAFSYTLAIEGAALLVALLGLFNTFLISVIERTQEIGVLRALGMSKVHIRRLILEESFFQGGLGSIVATALATVAAYFLVTHSLSNLLGWVLHFSVPWGALGMAALIGMVVTLIAGIYPAHRAASFDISKALEYE